MSITASTTERRNAVQKSINLFLKDVKSGNIEAVIVRIQRGPWDPVSAIFLACESGNIELLKLLREKINVPLWVVSKGPSYDMCGSGLCEIACKKNNFVILKYLYEQGCRLTEVCAVHAAANGWFDLLAWLLRNDCPVTEAASVAAAEHKHIEILNLLHPKNAERSKSECYPWARHYNILGDTTLTNWFLACCPAAFGYCITDDDRITLGSFDFAKYEAYLASK